MWVTSYPTYDFILTKHDLEPMVWDVVNVLDFDPVAVSAQLSRRPATIMGEWLRLDEELLKLVRAL